MTRLRKLALGLGLSLSLSLGLMAAPQAGTTKSATKAATADTKKAATTATTPQTPPGPGYVWVNKNTKVFHREGTKYFGNTKNGEFMKEADAVAAGYHEAGKPGGAKSSTAAPAAKGAAAGKKM